MTHTPHRSLVSTAAVLSVSALLLAGCKKEPPVAPSEPPPGTTAQPTTPPPAAPAPAPAPAPTDADAGQAAAGGADGGQAAAAGGAEITAEARAEAKQIFDTRCVACHGATGAGDGPAAASLNPKPRNYADQAWQASVTDQQIEKTILEGGAAVGKSPLMPGNPDLASKPAVVAALREMIRGFAKK